MEWKALANAIIHDGYRPDLRSIYFRCEKCGNPTFEVLVYHTVGNPRAARRTVYVTRCPACRQYEMNVIHTRTLGTRDVPGQMMASLGLAIIEEMAIARRVDPFLFVGDGE